MLRIGVLGCGRIGQVHARSVMQLDTAQLVAVSDAFDQSANDLAARTGAEARSTDVIIASDDIDAIIICTPTDTHYDRHSPSGLRHDGKFAGRGRTVKHFLSPDLAWPGADVRLWVFQAKRRGHPVPSEAFFSASDRPVEPVSFSWGPDCGHAHDGGARSR